MNQFLSNSGAFAYSRILKPILFRLKPDNVHSFAVRAGVNIGRSELLLTLLNRSWAYDNPKRLGQSVHGVYMKNPIGLSAGFDKNIELPAVLRAIGFGFMEGGTVTNKAYGGNTRPWFYRLPHSKSLIVRAGLANEGIDRVVVRLKSRNNNVFSDFPLNISIAHTNLQKHQTEDAMIRDNIQVLKKVKRAKIAQMITINISCPNTYNGEVFTKPAALKRLLTQVEALKLTQPVFLKMPCDLSWKEFDSLLRVAVEHHISGVTICNLTGDRTKISPLDDSTAKWGGLSGKLVYEQSNRLIARTYKKYGTKLTIIGVGGVFTAADAYKKLRLGASLVEMVTGLIYEGPQVVGKINKGLVELLEKDGFSSVSDVIGIDTTR